MQVIVSTNSETLYNGHHWGPKISTIIEGWPQVRGFILSTISMQWGPRREIITERVAAHHQGWHHYKRDSTVLILDNNYSVFRN